MKKTQVDLKKNRTMLCRIFTLSLSNDPYPNNADVICSDPIIRANDAGKLRNRLSSNALF